ncbi:MAG TPA: hypothetical protein VKY24_10710 [Reyranella sp.]|nr:hypothetical protein [Reyranella sp.]
MSYRRMKAPACLLTVSLAMLAASAVAQVGGHDDADQARTDAMFGMHGYTPVPQDNVFATAPGLEQQARRSTFTFNIVAPIAFTSNALSGPSGVPTDQNSAKFNPSAGLSWTAPVFDLPFKITVNARAELDRFTVVPSADFDKIFLSGRLQYVDANNDQAFSPYVSYGPRLSYTPFYAGWLQTRQDLTFGINKTFNYDANFQRVAFSGNSFAETTWSFGVTTGFQRRFANPPPSSWAVFLVPSASYVISPQWNLGVGVFMQRRGFDSFLGQSDEEWFIEPIATLEFVLPSRWFGSEANAALIGRPALDFQVAYEKNWSPLATFNYDQWVVGAALKFGWRF